MCDRVGLFHRLMNLLFLLYKFLFLSLSKGLFLLKLEQMSKSTEFPGLLRAILMIHITGESLWKVVQTRQQRSIQ